MQDSERIGRSAGLAGTATLVSRLLGLVRDQVLAGLFGAGNEMDAFVVAFRVPNLVRDLFAEGAMSAAFVPTFTRHLALRGKEEAWRLGNNVINALVLVTGGLVLVGILSAPLLIAIVAPDFEQVPGKGELTVQLTRITLPFLTMTAVAAAMMGMLNSLRHYFVPALSPASFNLVTIVCAFVLVPVMPSLGLPRITAIAIAALIGGFTQVMLQWYSLRGEGFHYEPRLDWRDPALGRVLLLMGPGTLGLAATQVNLFVATLLATSQGTGAVSWLQYAFRLMYLPIGLFGVSIATAVLPQAARHAAGDDLTSVGVSVARGLGLMLVLNVPAAAGLWVLATDIVRLLFEHGRFLPSDTVATAAALRFYAIGLLGYSATRITAPVFYALGHSRIPVAVSVMSVTANVLLSVGLVNVMGFKGLALATSCAALLNALTSLTLLRRYLGSVHDAYLVQTFIKTAIASFVMAAAVIGMMHGLAPLIQGDRPVVQLVRLCAGIGGGLVTLTLAARVLHIAEWNELVGSAWMQAQKLLIR